LLVGALRALLLVGALRAQGLAAHEDVLRHGQVGEQRRLLVDHRDAGRPGVGRPVQHQRSPVEGERARVRGVRPGQDLDQGRLSRTVLADEPVCLSPVQVQPHVAQRGHRAERLAHAPQRQLRRRRLAH
jgi:hypothetical protein